MRHVLGTSQAIVRASTETFRESVLRRMVDLRGDGLGEALRALGQGCEQRRGVAAEAVEAVVGQLVGPAVEALLEFRDFLVERIAADMPTGAPDLPFECLAMPLRTSHERLRPRKRG